MDTSLIQEYIGTNQLFDHNDKIVVGLSGGADSVALFDILHTLGYNCIAAHCNFHLRAEESNRDEQFVKDMCSRYNVDLVTTDFDTEQYAKEHSISIEMAARELRYTWFEELRVKYKANYIAVAHHQDDSVETVLLNLIRGTGIRGLTGIAPKTGIIVRPLLGVSRTDIEAYLGQKGISYVNDSTNAEDIYTRNKIRLNIIPLMESINPSVKKSIDRTSEHLIQVKNIYLEYIGAAKSVLLNDNAIDINLLKTYTEPKAILFEILYEYNFKGDIVDDIFSNLDGESGKVFYSSTHKLLKDRDYLLLKDNTIEQRKEYNISKKDKTLSYPIGMKIERIEKDGNFEIEKDKNILYLDESQIEYPLVLRRWELGDWFIPFGMKGRKKLSDYFSDAKLSLFDKENTWILCNDDDIVWIVGHRSDDRYRIGKESSKILKITCQE